MNAGVTYYNEKSHLINDIIDEELPLMFNKDGMKMIIGSPQNSPIVVSTRNITIDKVYEHLERDSILRTILDFEKGICMDEIVNMNVAEKRKFDRESSNRQVRQRTNSEPSQMLTPPMPPANSQQSQSVYMKEVPDEEMADVQILPTCNHVNLRCN